MEDNYLFEGISPEEYYKLKLAEKNLLKAAKNDFNEFNGKFWKPKIKDVTAKIGYIPEFKLAYMNFGSETEPRLFRYPEGFSEAEKVVAFNLRYQMMKCLDAIRKVE